MFNNMDTDKSGTITLEELKIGLTRLGSKLTETEIKQLMDAVSTVVFTSFPFGLQNCLTHRLLQEISSSIYIISLWLA